MEEHHQYSRRLINSISKKLWKLLRLVLIGIRKSISRSSYRPILKRVKIAAIILSSSSSNRHNKYPFAGPRLAYEFSCSNSPATHQWPHSPDDPSRRHFEEEDQIILGRSSMLMGHQQAAAAASSSPALPGFGFGRSPAVRQLRITDSPFPINYVAENIHIDDDADKFIAKFYRELFNQRLL
ncbi:hypothetical protein QQ045_024778 [Rhodiola kirilowii]